MIRTLVQEKRDLFCTASTKCENTNRYGAKIYQFQNVTLRSTATISSASDTSSRHSCVVTTTGGRHFDFSFENSLFRKNVELF